MTITASDSPGGVFSLSPTSITLSEESAPTGTITVERSGGVLTEVRIEWEALYTDGQIHNTAINSILGVDRATVIFPVGVTSVDISLTLQPNSVSYIKNAQDAENISMAIVSIVSTFYCSGTSNWGGFHAAYSVR